MKWRRRIFIMIAEILLALDAIINILSTGGRVLDYGYLGFMCVSLLLTWVKKES